MKNNEQFLECVRNFSEKQTAMTKCLKVSLNEIEAELIKALMNTI